MSKKETTNPKEVRNQNYETKKMNTSENFKKKKDKDLPWWVELLFVQIGLPDKLLLKILKAKKTTKDFNKNVELVLAKIYDIDDEDIQKEYMSAFNKVVYLYDELKEDYEREGFSDNSEELLTSYKNAFNLFESEFEI